MNTTEYRKKNPWRWTLYRIQQRCNNKNSNKYKRYGARGIECRITADELKRLWFMDNAHLMKKPSIDRIDNDGHYTFGNCHYIEFSENTEKGNKQKMRPIVQKSMDGRILKTYRCISDAIKKLGKDKKKTSWLYACLYSQKKSCYGFKWEFLKEVE